MNFSELYKNNRSDVEKTIKAMWCGEAANDSQKAYHRQMNEVIGELFAPKAAVPVVQCMNSYESVHTVTNEEAEAVVGDLWKKTLPEGKYYAPYEHQYRSWHTLLEDNYNDKPRSIVVTTGTGSGKTECFMLPLVHDLDLLKVKNQIQAIFLYPLNALMEDQKERLERLLEGTELTYTVYNGDLPEKAPDPTSEKENDIKLRKRIEQLTGGKYERISPDKVLGENKTKYVLQNVKYERMLYTREQVRNTPPNILLTNPTMLEYVLLRGSDAPLINESAKSLRWVVIDETHTYTGAGAAEMAMLLRRVMLAFNVEASDIRFATSSATFGNAKTEDERQLDNDKLKDFIGGITGLKNDQIEVIDGKRVGEDCIPEGEDGERWRMIFNSDFIELDKLYRGEESIEEKLQMLDEMCQREEDRYKAEGKKTPDMKLKVHYFYRVPNNGLYVRLDEHKDGAFKIYTENTVGDLNDEETPMLELCRCKNCGEYVTVGVVGRDGNFEPMAGDDSDMFDLPDETEDRSGKQYYIFGLSNEENIKGDNNTKIYIDKGKIAYSTVGELKPDEWHVVANTQCRCPYCNIKQTRRHNIDKEIDADAMGNMDDTRLQRFRLSAEFISRRMAPSVLDQLDENKPRDDKKPVFHRGQQYISFVDSRQAAAKATMKQNLDQERLWFYTTIYKELCHRKIYGLTDKEKAIANVQKVIATNTTNPAMLMKYAVIMQNLLSTDKNVVRKQMAEIADTDISWTEIADLIEKDDYCKVFCRLFVKKTSDSDEFDSDGKIPESVIKRYVQSIMVMYLANRPASAASPETMGLFHTCYPQLKDVVIPAAVERYNALMDNPANRITDEDWRSLIQVFMDYTVRSNQSVFLKLPNDNTIDIFKCVRFSTEKQHRRPVTKPIVKRGAESTSRVVRFLCGLIVRDEKTLTLKEAQETYFDEISGVVDALWNTLTDSKNRLLEQSQKLDGNGGWENDSGESTRLNLVNLSFKLYDDVYLCDTTTDAAERLTTCLRPIENNFKRFSPYLAATKPVELPEDLHEKWETYPYYENEKHLITADKVNEWAADKRKLLWNNGLWGTDGVFSTRLTEIHSVPELFIQAEHTAQVDKDVARTLQRDFKDHRINILACSTTMEMGVDLGNLEVVMLSSVPPMPANYKQRAGRSGRNNKVRSACITLCGSDAIGLRTLYNPIEKVISRKVHVPSVDLKSQQVVQRHVNSFLVREFGVFSNGAHGGSLRQKVVDYYTTFHIDEVGGRYVVRDMNNGDISANNKLGSEKGTMYEIFNEECAKPLTKERHDRLCKLLENTIYDDNPYEAIDEALRNNQRCYGELSTKIEDYSEALKNADKEKTKYINKLNMLYIELLNEKLINYWATNRFTPNANMPVNVLSLDINTYGEKDFLSVTSSSNPSYSLREAIAQYAPGNTIVVDGVAYVVRGVSSSSLYRDSKSFKRIYHNQNKTVLEDSTAIASKIKWNVNGKEHLELIQPAGFLPDINEDMTRIIDTNDYTHVSAQLIDADDWTSGPADPHLISMRSNKESGDAKILYYNEGSGHGYCYCTSCGRMVIENDVADDEEPNRLPPEMNPRKPKKKIEEETTDSDVSPNIEVAEKPYYHFAISGKELKKACYGSYHSKAMRRNVIIGDLIQTDFTEIRIRHKGMTNSWITGREENKNLLYTLGIVFSQSLVEILGKERGAVDFTIMPNGHICIFDTNPGGAGYANQMSKMVIMKDVLTTSEDMLQQAKSHSSKDMLLDKHTLRYSKYIDIDAALEWIKNENEAWAEIPTAVSDIYPNAVQRTLLDMRKAFATSCHEVILFADDDFGKWNYNDGDNGWRKQLLNHFIVRGMNAVRFCVSRYDKTTMHEPIKSMLRSVKEWTKDVVSQENPIAGNGLHPLAYIDGELFFTNNNENSSLNELWGGGALFSTRTNYSIIDMAHVDCDFTETTKNIILTSDMPPITSKRLGETIQNGARQIVDSFLNHCKNCNAPLEVCYQDIHMKSVFSIVLTLQTIGHFVKLISKDFSLEFKTERYYDPSAKCGIQSNIYNSERRNDILEKQVATWAENLKSECGINCELKPVTSDEHGQLTHWRELSLRCGNKTLSIYPDGGFANGWSLNVEGNRNYDADHTTTRDDIKMRLKQDVKIGVEMGEK